MAAKKKFSNMSEEERCIFLERQRLREEEEKKKKEDMLYRYLKNKLLKEEAVNKVNMLKVQTEWRVIMRTVKSEELTKDIDVMKQAFENKVDRMNDCIRSLTKDLEESEEQYQVALCSHIHKVSDLTEFQTRRVKDLEEGYKDELKTIQVEFDTERELMKMRHDQEMKDLRDIIYAMELRYSEREKEESQDFQSTMDELKNRNLEDSHLLNAQRKATLDDLWTEFQKETKHYKDTTEERKLRFETLKKKDEDSSNAITQQMRKLHKLQESICSLRHKMAANTKVTEERIKSIKQDREILLSHFHALKHEMALCRESERRNLTTLTVQSDTAIKELQRKRDRVELVLKLAEMCRKLETEEEKVLPFYSSSLTLQEEWEAKEDMARPPSEPIARMMKDYLPLQHFWKRYNKVQLDKLSLDREKLMSKKENSRLRATLKQYLDGISVNPDVMDYSNPLMVTTKKTPLPARQNVPVGDPRIEHLQPASITVVEASHIAQHIT